MKKTFKSLEALATVPIDTLRSYCDIVWQSYLKEESDEVKRTLLEHYSEIADFYLDRKYPKSVLDK